MNSSPRAFSPREQRVLQLLMETAIPPHAGLPTPESDVLQGYLRLLAQLPPAVDEGLRKLISLIEHGAMMRFLRPFTSLSADQRERYLSFLYRSNYASRTVIWSVLAGLKYGYFEDPAVKRYFGFPQYSAPAREAIPRHVRERIVSSRDLEPGEVLEAEVIVVGTGAGGAVVARELAQRGHAVVMLESGRFFSRNDFVADPRVMSRRLYRDSGLTMSVGNTPIVIPLGHAVGGTTIVNSGTCYRTPDKVLHSWASDLGLRELAPDAMATYFEQVEHVLRVAPASLDYVGGTALRIARGAEALGLKHGPLDRNAPDCDGQGLCTFGCPTDAKRSTNVSYIPLALKQGAMVISEAPVETLLCEKGEVRGVIARGVRADGSHYALTVRAPVVVLACGSIYTPHLLMKNDLCGGSHELGRNLTIHPAANAFAVFDEDLRDHSAIPQGYAIESFKDQGMLFEGGTTPLGIAASSIQLIGQRFSELMTHARGLGNFGFMISDSSRGSVIAGPKRPIILYSLNREDQRRIIYGLGILARVYFAAGAQCVIPNVNGFEVIESEADVERFLKHPIRPRDLQLSAFHPLGTARMGHHPSSSVVDHTHETHEVRNLFIVDGSVIPSPLGVNPQITIMALATRAAEKIDQRLNQLH